MHRTREPYWSARLLVFACLCVVIAPSARGQLRPHPAALANASDALVERLRADPFTYFRFINRAWIGRVCAAFADLNHVPIVRLHGDAHVEPFAVTKDAWGLDDFDDSARGPLFIDVVRFLGSIDLVARQRGWERSRDALWSRFFEGYRRGLSNPEYRPPEPDIVRRVRAQSPASRASFLAWGESQMLPMEETARQTVIMGMGAFERFIRERGERADLRPGFFTVTRAGWIRLGVGSYGINKLLIRVEGPTADPDDDVLIEGKEVINLDALDCLEAPPIPAAVQIIDGPIN